MLVREDGHIERADARLAGWVGANMELFKAVCDDEGWTTTARDQVNVQTG